MSENLEQDLMRRLLNWKNGIKENPFKMILFPTNKCNLKCIFCKGSLSRDFYKYGYELTDKQWINVVKWGIKSGVKQWWITGGGEPLMRKGLTMKMISLIKSSSGYCDLMTNATLFDESIIKKFIHMEMDRILVSLDGYNEKTNDSLRGKGSFKHIITTLNMFKRIKKNLGREKPIIQVNSIINSINCDEISNFVNLLQKFNVKILSLHPLLIYEETKNKIGYLFPSSNQKKQIKKELNKTKMLGKKHGIEIDSGAIEAHYLQVNRKKDKIIKKDNLPYCFEPWYTMLIDMNGKVAPCCPAGAKSEECPNIREISLKNIWRGDYFTNFRKRIENNQIFDICKNCGVINLTMSLKERILSHQIHSWNNIDFSSS